MDGEGNERPSYRGGQLLDCVRSALAEAGEVPLQTLSQVELADWVCSLERLKSSLDAMAVVGVAAGDAAGIQTLAGLRTVGAFVGARVGVDPKVVGAERALGLWLDRFEVFTQGAVDGILSRRHLQVLREADNRRTHDALLDAQEYLTKAAQGCTWADFVRVVRYWVLMFDPDGDEPKEQIEGRKCSVRKRSDGTVVGSFQLDPVSGHELKTALEAEEQRLFRHDSANDVKRTATQRRADALVNLVTRGAKNRNASAPVPLVHMVMSERVAAHELARLDSDPAHSGLGLIDAGGMTNPDRLPLDPFDVDGRCELVDGTPLHPAYALGALATGVLRRLVLEAPSEILDLGEGVRLYPPRLKQALLAAARGRCSHEGCDAPFAWLQADHHIPASRGGPTSTGNAKILCDPHNKDKADKDPTDRDSADRDPADGDPGDDDPP